MKVKIIGCMNINGEEKTGIFIKASVQEMRMIRNLFDEEVEIFKADKNNIQEIPDYLKMPDFPSSRGG